MENEVGSRKDKFMNSRLKSCQITFLNQAQVVFCSCCPPGGPDEADCHDKSTMNPLPYLVVQAVSSIKDNGTAEVPSSGSGHRQEDW